MAITYTELIKWLRSEADAAEREWVIDGIHECSVAKKLTAAADAIETLSKGINAYADEAFKRAQELSYARERIDELDELCIVYCNERDRLKVQLDEVNEERAELRRRIEELVDKLAAERVSDSDPAAEAAAMYADKADPAPVWIASRKSILEDAEKCVCGHREEDYGSPEDSFATIAHLWTVYSGHLFTPVDVAMMMALLKIARIAGGRGSEDSFVDLAGYAACGGEIWSKREAMEG